PEPGQEPGPARQEPAQEPGEAPDEARRSPSEPSPHLAASPTAEAPPETAVTDDPPDHTQPLRVPRHLAPYQNRPAADTPADAGTDPATDPVAEPSHEQETPGQEPGAQDDGEVRRVGRPPGGRPTRPDLLVASGPPRPGGSSGRHHRGPAPAAVRRSSPMRRRNRAVPVVLSLVAALIVAAGVLVWQWATPRGPALRVDAGTGRSGDELFTVPAASEGAIQRLNDMVAVGKTVVAVGSDITNPTPRPLFLYSADGGKIWKLGQVTGTTTPTVQRVVGGAGRWLAIGGESGLWTSTDGFGWTAVPMAEPAFRPGDAIADIARTSSGFAAVGRTRGPDGGTGPAAWRSDDGETWERVETRGLEVLELAAVVARQDTVVAVGRPSQGEGSRVLRSADGGRTWQVTALYLPEATPRIGTLAVLPKQFVLVPTGRRTVSGDVRVYCSPTGAEWAQCGSIVGLSEQSPGIETVISYKSGIAAISQSTLGKYAVLTSPDGRAWNRRVDLENPPGATLRGFAINDAGTLLAGGDQAASDVDNQLVLMTAPQRGNASRVRLNEVAGLTRVARETNRVTSHAGRYVAVGSAAGDAGLWTIKDWKSWKSMSIQGPGRQTLDDVAHGRRGWLAVGSTEASAAVTDPLLVYSDDGESWKEVPVTGDLARDRDQPYLGVHAVAAGQKGYVLAGESKDPSGASAAALWFTPDLRKFTRAKKLPQGGAGVRVHDVIAIENGYLAVGGSGGGDQEKSVIWFSGDGVNWSARERLDPPDSTASGLRQVVERQGRLVAIGTALSAGSRRAFAAVSDDEGESWKTAWLPAERAASVHDLAAAEQGLVAVGWHGEPGDGDSAVWTSQDGLTWNRTGLTKDRLAGPGMQWLSSVAVSGSEVVALGRSTTYDADHLILWTSSLSANR
ncbi:hypothetical protein HII36_50760, partial [Nonomuraea sp. NN258]|nr:hypothetical protein [Nonomuraea antri]